jgi:hypothetical protein
MSEKVRKIGLYYFYWQKKFGKLDFVIFIDTKSKFPSCFWIISFGIPNSIQNLLLRVNVPFPYHTHLEKDAEIWTLSFLLMEKARKVELYHF